MPPRTHRRRIATVSLLVAVAIALLAGGVVASGASTDGGAAAADRSVAAQDGEPLVEPCAAEMPEDYADPTGGTADTIGWVDGYWYDEPIGVNASDGLTDRELKQVTARTAARVEAMRCLPFADGLPPIEVLDHAEFANRTGDRYSGVDATNRRLLDAQLSTLLMVPDETDSVDVVEETAANGTLGQYFIEEDRIVLVRPEGSTAPIRESTLFQELGHALQDQQFDLSVSGERTSDESNAWTGLVEGDINWLELQYVDRCEAGRWTEPCITPDPTDSDAESGDSASTDPPSWGYSLARQQPYYEGPAYVQQVHEAGGWDAVNALYDDVPETSLAVTAPGAEDAEFVDPEIDVEPTGEWDRLTIENGTSHDEVGVGWIASTFMAPSWESDFQQNVVQPSQILHTNADGEIREVGGITYDPAAAMGWRGDRLAVYERGDETATVWRTAWADGDEAAEFADAYERLLEIRGASATEEHANAYAFDADSGYEGAVAVETEGDRVTIVSAPATDALTAVAPGIGLDGRADGAADESDESTDGATDGTDGAADGDAASDGDGSDAGGNGSDAADGDGDATNESDGDGDSLPGFGVVAGLVGGLLALAVLSAGRAGRCSE